MLRGVPARRGDSPERGEGGGLWAPDSCYLDGENMQTVVDLLCPQGDVMAWRLSAGIVCCRAAIMTERSPASARM